MQFQTNKNKISTEEKYEADYTENIMKCLMLKLGLPWINWSCKGNADGGIWFYERILTKP